MQLDFGRIMDRTNASCDAWAVQGMDTMHSGLAKLPASCTLRLIEVNGAFCSRWQQYTSPK
ncbi:MAG: hypothetical protein CMM73_03935 [Rhodospirillaceae bacterium]|nr:hypothetical protein [Rhodospirillaceae bacterium]